MRVWAARGFKPQVWRVDLASHHGGLIGMRSTPGCTCCVSEEGLHKQSVCSVALTWLCTVPGAANNAGCSMLACSAHQPCCCCWSMPAGRATPTKPWWRLMAALQPRGRGASQPGRVRQPFCCSVDPCINHCSWLACGVPTSCSCLPYWPLSGRQGRLAAWAGKAAANHVCTAGWHWCPLQGESRRCCALQQLKRCDFLAPPASPWSHRRDDGAAVGAAPGDAAHEPGARRQPAGAKLRCCLWLWQWVCSARPS